MLESLITMTSRERGEFLEGHATSISEGQYFRKFDDEDINQSRAEYTNKSIELNRLQNEFDLVKAEYKGKIKALETAKKEVMTSIMQSGEWLDGKQYGFDDQVRGLMEYYDENGQFISSRRLTPNERQLSINSAIAKAN